MFGRHNVQNSLVVAAIASEMGFDADVVRRALGDFKGVKRRFTITGEARGITVVADYGPDRKSVVSGKSVLVRVDLGGRRRLKQKQHTHNGITAHYKKMKKYHW